MPGHHRFLLSQQTSPWLCIFFPFSHSIQKDIFEMKSDYVISLIKTFHMFFVAKNKFQTPHHSYKALCDYKAHYGSVDFSHTFFASWPCRSCFCPKGFSVAVSYVWNAPSQSSQDRLLPQISQTGLLWMTPAPLHSLSLLEVTAFLLPSAPTVNSTQTTWLCLFCFSLLSQSLEWCLRPSTHSQQIFAYCWSNEITTSLWTLVSTEREWNKTSYIYDKAMIDMFIYIFLYYACMYISLTCFIW